MEFMFLANVSVKKVLLSAEVLPDIFI